MLWTIEEENAESPYWQLQSLTIKYCLADTVQPCRSQFQRLLSSICGWFHVPLSNDPLWRVTLQLMPSNSWLQRWRTVQVVAGTDNTGCVLSCWNVQELLLEIRCLRTCCPKQFFNQYGNIWYCLRHSDGWIESEHRWCKFFTESSFVWCPYCQDSNKTSGPFAWQRHTALHINVPLQLLNPQRTV